MNTLTFPTAVHPVTAQAMGDLQGACQDVRAALAEATTVAEAFTIYRHCAAMEKLLMTLTTEAMSRCDRLAEQS